MRAEYDFTDAKKNPYAKQKKQITITVGLFKIIDNK